MLKLEKDNISPINVVPKIKNIINQTQINDNGFKCNNCQIIRKGYNAENQICQPNEKVHKKKKYYICSCCGKTYYRAGRQKWIHLNPSKCKYCRKNFQHTLKLHKHIWNIHQCATKHDCYICKKPFQTLDGLRRHSEFCEKETRLNKIAKNLLLTRYRKKINLEKCITLARL